LWDGSTCTFHGRLVIAAGGAHSTIARILNSAPRSRVGRSDDSRDSKSTTVALRAYYEGVEGDSSRVDIFFDKRFFPGYAWVFPLGEGRANVGLGMVVDMNPRN